VLSRDVAIHHSDPRYRRPMSFWTPQHLSNPSALPHLYTTPDFYVRLTFTNRAEQHWSCCQSPGDSQPSVQRPSTSPPQRRRCVAPVEGCWERGAEQQVLSGQMTGTYDAARRRYLHNHLRQAGCGTRTWRL